MGHKAAPSVCSNPNNSVNHATPLSQCIVQKNHIVCYVFSSWKAQNLSVLYLTYVQDLLYFTSQIHVCEFMACDFGHAPVLETQLEGSWWITGFYTV